MSDPKLAQAVAILHDDKGLHQAETIRRAGLVVLTALAQAQEQLRAAEARLSEALNSGDGVYRP